MHIELRVFIGVILYIGLHVEANIELYWNTDIAKGLIYIISSYTSIKRY